MADANEKKLPSEKAAVGDKRGPQRISTFAQAKRQRKEEEKKKAEYKSPEVQFARLVLSVRV
jgi:hypothetical protein